MTDDDLIAALEQIKTLLISVSTGGPRIDDVERRYQLTYTPAAAELARRGLSTLVIFGSLWDWNARWSSGDLPTYQSLRDFIGGFINPVINQVRTGRVELPPPTGGERVDRGPGEMPDRLAAARNDEQFQTVGPLGLEALISVAQAVYERMRHPPFDNVEPSPTDGKRMLEAYIAIELGGSSNEAARKHARSSLNLAVALQHRPTATLREAALCAGATTSVLT